MRNSQEQCELIFTDEPIGLMHGIEYLPGRGIKYSDAPLLKLTPHEHIVLYKVLKMSPNVVFKRDLAVLTGGVVVSDEDHRMHHWLHPSDSQRVNAAIRRLRATLEIASTKLPPRLVLLQGIAVRWLPEGNI